jgi:hypothetical protein
VQLAQMQKQVLVLQVSVLWVRWLQLYQRSLLLRLIIKLWLCWRFDHS